jgi:hypothetical protein
MLKQFEIGNAPPEFAASEKDLYRQHYFVDLDIVINCVKDHFDHLGFQGYCLSGHSFEVCAW